MIHERNIRVLRQLLEATKRAQITWVMETDGLSEWYVSNLEGSKPQFRFLFYEATNQTGADPCVVDFSMFGMNARFAWGTEGFDLILEILGAAFSNWKLPDLNAAERYLHEQFLLCRPPEVEGTGDR